MNMNINGILENKAIWLIDCLERQMKLKYSRAVMEIDLI